MPLNDLTTDYQMMSRLKQLFLNERLMLIIIIINAVMLFLQESGIESHIINVIDIACTFIFIMEMIVKHCHYGVRGYWSSGWNRLDGTLVLLSIPSIVVWFFPELVMDFSFLLVIRVLRIFRFFRLVHAFPEFGAIMRNFALAIRRSYAVFVGLLIMIFTFAMVGCSLFKNVAPEYFATPLDSIYSTFRIFTGEGWNEIPDAVSAATGGMWGHLIRFYFCLILILGCIIGMSLLNSIFVDAMVSDNNDDVIKKLDQIQHDIQALQKQNNAKN